MGISDARAENSPPGPERLKESAGKVETPRAKGTASRRKTPPLSPRFLKEYSRTPKSPVGSEAVSSASE